MKKIVAISFALLILATSAKDVLTWASFKVNQDFIAKTLCINRDKPEKKCNGKCQLTKKIAESKEDGDPAKSPIPQPDEQKQLVYFCEANKVEFSLFTISNLQTGFVETTFSGQSCLDDIFQPPRALPTIILA